MRPASTSAIAASTWRLSRLRQKIGDGAREAQLIRTVRGEGYCFEAAVES